MPRRASLTDRNLHLPPPYDVVPLREAGDAFAHACAIADVRGAGTLVWVRRYDLAEFAVVLEPEEPLALARRVFYVGMNALADVLSAHAPPAREVTFDWPDALRVDGALVGGGRLGWPAAAAESDVPPWLVFAGTVRTLVIRAGEPGLRPLLGSLEEAGFTEIDTGEIVAGFSRHLMAGLHGWAEANLPPVAERWLDRLASDPGTRARLADNGDLLVFQGTGPEPTLRRDMVRALAAPSWLDPATGTPWL
jgi:hypothetical protein